MNRILNRILYIPKDLLNIIIDYTISICYDCCKDKEYVFDCKQCDSILYADHYLSERNFLCLQ